MHTSTRISVFAQWQILCISPNGLQAGHCDAPPPPFWMTENHFWSHFSPFQINTQLFLSQNGCRRPFWMTENNFRSHFWLFQINTQLLFFWFFGTKWLPAAILDDRKSLLIAFLAISDQYATFIFLSQNGCRRPFWITENHFWSHFSPFQINKQLLFFNKMAAGGYFGWPKITFNRITGHFRSNRNFSFFFLFFSKWPPAAILDDRKSLLIAFLAISDQYETFFFTFFFKMAAGGHFGSPIWAILDYRKSLSIAFLAISDQYTTFFL